MERRAIYVLAAVLAAALLMIAFLLGRESSPPRASAPMVAAPPVPPSAPAPPSGLVAPVVPRDEPRSDNGLSTGAPPVLSTLAPVTALAPGAPPASIAGRAEVAAYFQAVDAIEEDVKKATGDPEALAQLILKHAADGDMKNFDDLLAAQRALLNRLRTVAAPPSCAEHLQKSVAAVEDGIRLLQQTRDAVASRDMSNLTQLGAVGQDVERRAREVDALGTALKKQYGL
jgi:hypothetical protein